MDLNEKIKEANDLVDKELNKFYWNEKVLHVSKRNWLIIGVVLIIAACIF